MIKFSCNYAYEQIDVTILFVLCDSGIMCDALDITLYAKQSLKKFIFIVHATFQTFKIKYKFRLTPIVIRQKCIILHRYFDII